ncbi:MAG TPA: ADP-forming succinate--CoA ligase subunit beta [Syntrophorhabdaceae bacterium]|nr:ADP-forming succinate--CoA ligase subunit beta [Syntrophorhabdaceae bacterium]HQM80603.1 ADP-forming succinate--CoA ligase subunit beta [Syntrophorhabdaceae bacterium]
MKIHEYQAKGLFRTYNIPVPQGAVAKTTEEAFRIAEEIGKAPFVLKAQVHAGGRGKAGGIRIINRLGDVKNTAAGLLGMTLVTPQTGEEGKPVQALLVEETLPVEKEIYLGIVIDRQRACPVVIASAEGGMEIEKIAAADPEKVLREEVDPAVGLRPFQAGRIFYGLGLDQSLSRRMISVILNLFRLFVEKDCSLAEINPLVVTKSGELVALDAKINLDDNAFYRHQDMESLRDINQENHLEVEASKYNLNYIKLKGNVGCMVNGAGLAMATMDLIKLVGAEPANFLDVGGGATSEMVKQGLKILLYDKDVKMVFINIFGGILRCDTLAEGVVKAVDELIIDLPIVIRLEGTNVEEGRKILAGSGLSFTVATGLKDAAEKVAATLEQLQNVKGVM